LTKEAKDVIMKAEDKVEKNNLRRVSNDES